MSIINRWPENVEQLAKVDDIRSKNVREDGELILSILANARQVLTDKGAVASIQKPLDPIWNKRFKLLKKIAATVAQEQSIALELVLRKKDLEALVRTKQEFGEYQIPESLQGWREQLFGAQVLEQLQQFEE